MICRKRNRSGIFNVILQSDGKWIWRGAVKLQRQGKWIFCGSADLQSDENDGGKVLQICRDMKMVVDEVLQICRAMENGFGKLLQICRAMENVFGKVLQTCRAKKMVRARFCKFAELCKCFFRCFWSEIIAKPPICLYICKLVVWHINLISAKCYCSLTMA